MLALLKTLSNPANSTSLMEAGLVKALTIEHGAARFVLEVSGSHPAAYGKLKDEIVAK